ncbi:Uncharacterized protein At4g02000 [Linum grandiflorum]
MFRNRIADLWRPYRGIKIEELEEGRILFRFFHEIDLRWVMENSPWTYESCLIVMAAILPGQTPAQIPLNMADFWVQGYKMPNSYCTTAVGRVVGDHVGNFVSMDEEHKFTPEEPYMRLRARMDVSKPLKKEKKIRRPGGDWVIITLKYEKLPTFCFTCGRMGHVDRGYALRFQAGNSDIPQRWSAELRAPPRRKKQIIKSRYLVDDEERDEGLSRGGGHTSKMVNNKSAQVGTSQRTRQADYGGGLQRRS